MQTGFLSNCDDARIVQRYRVQIEIKSLKGNSKDEKCLKSKFLGFPVSIFCFLFLAPLHTKNSERFLVKGAAEGKQKIHKKKNSQTVVIVLRFLGLIVLSCGAGEQPTASSPKWARVYCGFGLRPIRVMAHPSRKVRHQSASSCLRVCLCGGCGSLACVAHTPPRPMLSVSGDHEMTRPTISSFVTTLPLHPSRRSCRNCTAS